MDKPAKCAKQWNISQQYEPNRRINAQDHLQNERAHGSGAYPTQTSDMAKSKSPVRSYAFKKVKK